jgi:hypothetical protein
MYGIYECRYLNVENNVLTIWDAEFIGMAKSADDFNRVYDIFCKEKGISPNRIICPALYCEQRKITLCVFENSQK